MDGYPVEQKHTLLYFADGSLAWAGRHLHENVHPVHTHSFFEVALVMAGEGVHVSLNGRQALRVGDVLVLRPGVWHGYEDCRGLDLYNCCFSADLMNRELAWTRHDRSIGHLLWTGPYSGQRRGILTSHLDDPAFGTCVEHLEGLHALRSCPVDSHRGDIVGRLSLFLGVAARAIVQQSAAAAPVTSEIHPAVLDAMRMMEAQPAYPWTLTEIAAGLHLAPGYLVRLFKSATGLPPMAYLSRLRVELAATRLLHSDQPINRIGESVGWPDQNYFARRFKSHYGLSASTYRSRFTRTLKPLR